MPSILESIRESFTSRIGRAAQLVVLGQALNGLIGFGLNVLLIRKLSVDDYGLFSLFSSTLVLISGFMPFGWLDTFVVYGSRYRQTEHFKFLRQAVFNNVMLFSVLVGGVIILVSPWLIVRVYHREGFYPYLVAAVLGAWTMTLFNFTTIYYRTLERFKEYFVAQVASTAMRAGICLALLAAGQFTLFWIAAAYIVAPLLFCGTTLALAKNLVRARLKKINPKIYAEIFDYNKWIVASSVLFMLTGNINAQILAKYHNNASLGDFGVISRFTLPIYFVLAGITTTALPRLSASPDHETVKRYLRKLMELLLPSALVFAVVGWYSPPVVHWLAGPKYSNLATLFRLQVAVVLLSYLNSPVSLILSAWGWSRVLTAMNVLQLAINVVAAFLWIPPFGARGAVLANLAVNAVGLVMVYALVGWTLWLQRSRRRRPKRS